MNGTSNVYMTLPGKLGDAVLELPIAYWYAKQKGVKVNLWLDKNTLKPLVPLLEVQSWVGDIELRGGVESYHCGGQPFHMNLETADFLDRRVFHLGLRVMPQRQITLQTMADCKVPIEVDQDLLANTPYFEVPDSDSLPILKNGSEAILDTSKRICVLHGQSVCPHTKSTPHFWKFVHSIRQELKDLFDEVVFVGSDRDRETGISAYPYFSAFDDQGSFLELAKLVKQAKLMIGVGSSGVTMGGALKVPTIRVHDPIGDNPRQVWDNLGSNQLNRTEVELRKDWTVFRDQWVAKEVPV